MAGKDLKAFAKKLLEQEAARILRVHGDLSSDELYEQALQSAVRHLLSQRRQESEAGSGPYKQLSLPFDTGPIPDPTTIGQVYERIRALEPVIGEAGNVTAQPSPLKRRNQGLFYTPPSITACIAEWTLEALKLDSPERCLSVKILDPAMGTGAFLAEVLRRLTARVAELEYDCEANHGIDIGRYLQEHCIYGIDTDPTATEIGRAVLSEQVSDHRSTGAVRAPNIRVGNSLIGVGNGAVERSQAACDEAIRRVFSRMSPGKQEHISRWPGDQQVFHWVLEMPEVFDRENPGFDAVIGNPPYEVLSAKESGIEARRAESEYYRLAYTTCRGKINTYRLMIERGMNLLRDGGVLGFIVPATLLSDTTAALLREKILNESEILKAVVIPEKARVFEDVTQALLILVLRKGGRTRSVTISQPAADSDMNQLTGASVSIELVERLDNRIPILRSETEGRLLEALEQFPRFAGEPGIPPVGIVHQGEVNLTTDREYLSYAPTDYPLVRGEHIEPFRLTHPTPNRSRLDWVIGELVEHRVNRAAHSAARVTGRGEPWTEQRIVMGRVVNMATRQRLKAAPCPAGMFAADMTNYICGLTVPIWYLIGLLNSRLLNWRFRLTSTNNYISAAEIMALPVVRPAVHDIPEDVLTTCRGHVLEMMKDNECTSSGALTVLQNRIGSELQAYGSALTARLISIAAEETASRASQQTTNNRPAVPPVIDALTLRLYGVKDFPLELN